MWQYQEEEKQLLEVLDKLQREKNETKKELEESKKLYKDTIEAQQLWYLK